ncbi:MAG TPA: hypothetical protein DD706_17905 [Nitrospiraceae bacterium]|nr:hypothetical protein [Nitrospiraceae bacterium]
MAKSPLGFLNYPQTGQSDGAWQDLPPKAYFFSLMFFCLSDHFRVDWGTVRDQDVPPVVPDLMKRRGIETP